jgi:SAM-dependent methyltransferase
LADVVCFFEADIQEYEAPPGRFDTVLMECVLSKLERKQETLNRLNKVLTPGGRIALSDVTLRGELPDDLNGIVASALCIGDALSPDQYVELVQSAGFQIVTAEEVKDVALEFIEGIRTALMMADAAVGLGKLDVSKESIKQVRTVVRSAQESIENGQLSYSIIVAEKPA